MKPHRVRIFAMQAIYQLDMDNTKSFEDVSDLLWIDYPIIDEEKWMFNKIVKGVIDYKEEIDNIIKEYSENWDFDRITPVTKSILRMSIYQLLYMYDANQYKILIDEAIRLAKKYAEPESTRFINGILDSFYKIKIVLARMDTPT